MAEPSSTPRTFPSASYINRHRRSPSMYARLPLMGSSQPQLKASRSNSLPAEDAIRSGAHVWRSPSMTPKALIPAGAVISPPDSKNNSSDDEDESDKKEKEKQMFAELQAAIISIDERSIQSSVGEKAGSGNEVNAVKTTPAPLDLSLARAAETHQARRLSRSEVTPKHSHSNSANGVLLAHSPEIATHTPEDSDREDDMDLSKKPPKVRKKSGELVRPALRPARRRPSSAPGTPTFSKAVHFDSQLEHIRHFLQLDKPLAVSAGSSPVENYDGDTEFPFGQDEPATRSGAYEWEARVANFPSDSDVRGTMPVRLERIFMSSDNKNLVGVVAVANLSFHKHIVARFTLDYWRTTSEVVAEYNNDVRRKQAQDGYDRFNFNIRLADHGNLETKRMFICIRYNVNGLEFWDNNSSMNYHVEFFKKPKSGVSPLGSRPVVPRSRASATSVARPRSMPPYPADSGFGSSGPVSLFDDRDLCSSPKRLTSSHDDDDAVFDAPTRRTKPAAQAFGNRYDFGASLSAAMQPGSAGQTRRRLPSASTRTSSESNSSQAPQPGPDGSKPKQTSPKPPMKETPNSSHSSASSPGSSRPADLASGRPYHQSPVYKELVDKYCFVGLSTRV
ncbi:hypothetical protein AJ80_09002 [Polytolypa hystricis UAMH7299]|uniref:CBM21 domain-containing protein n=1 Tax=Polytolypa hystricis (strain UAMH7299) TaxID=1447883 RepID=A0A2B7WY31_POLH7|nr:hypothetical protein AJ80_09002 [Polytolypa hystricis UAMH7299]